MRITIASAAALLLCAGCACGRAVSVGGDLDASVDLDVGPPDSGDRFALRDAGPLPPGCASVERITSALPDLGDGAFDRRPAIAADSGRVLLVDRVDVVDGAVFHFYAGELAGAFVEIGQWEAAGSTVRAMRFRDGAWDVVIDLPAPELLAWLRVYDDGRVEVTRVPAPDGPTLNWLEVESLHDRFLALMADADDPARALRVIDVRPDGNYDALDIAPGANHRWQLVVRAASDEALVVGHDPILGDPPRILRLGHEPLRVTADWVEVGDFHYNDYLAYRLHDTPGGLVSTTFRQAYDAGSRSPRRLEVRWLDESFQTRAEWSMETVVLGSVSVLGAPPAQHFVITLDDSVYEGRNGTATVFHALSTRPGEMSALSPIDRSRAAFPPTPWVYDDGRFALLNYDGELRVDVLCEGP